MKNILVFACVLLAVVSCNKQANVKPEQQNYPGDIELFNHEKDAEVATKKPPHPPKGGGNPNNPTDTITPPTTQGTTVIYYDFDGEQVNGIWGTFYAGPSGLTYQQQQQVLAIVRLRYAGFPIRITDSLSVFLSYPINKRIRVIETNNTTLYPGTGGVAYIGSYLWADDTPAFVFTNRYGNNVEWVAYASVHEAGHTIGLRHQSVYDGACNKIQEYRPGWNMGAYNGQTYIFGTGTSSACCTCIQDDVSIINSNL